MATSPVGEWGFQTSRDPWNYNLVLHQKCKNRNKVLVIQNSIFQSPQCQSWVDRLLIHNDTAKYYMVLWCHKVNPKSTEMSVKKYTPFLHNSRTGPEDHIHPSFHCFPCLSLFKKKKKISLSKLFPKLLPQNLYEIFRQMYTYVVYILYYLVNWKLADLCFSITLNTLF